MSPSGKENGKAKDARGRYLEKMKMGQFQTKLIDV
jgi:hypothetical protein